MNLAALALTFAVTITAALGNLCLSAGARTLARLNPTNPWAAWDILHSNILLLGIVLYGASFVLYLKLLSQAEISRVYPIVVGGAFVIVLIGANLYLGERITAWRVAGCALIFLGIAFSSR